MYRYNYTNLFLSLLIITYTVLLFVSLDFYYFWDNIQQTSSEAHFFYYSNFTLFPTNQINSEFGFTGYHPPLMGVMTALLWKIFGYNIWVSHAFIYLWALILIYNLHKLVSVFFSENQIGWVLMILLFEPTVLAQFVIASPDFILLTAFVISIRAIIERKYLLLSIGIFFLFGINMRGVFAGLVILLVHLIYFYYKSDCKLKFNLLLKSFSPYLPTLMVLAIYYAIYLNLNGWFFTNSHYSEHYTQPVSLYSIITHLAEFGLRSLENGRFLIWGLAIYMLSNSIKNRNQWSNEDIFIAYLFGGLISIYLIFIFITQMPFSARYFMPFFLLLSIITLKSLIFKLSHKSTIYLFALILFVELTGNFWIYPEKIAKSWDTTLAHVPYYSLRNECFNYIEENKINYNDISAGFCLYGNRKVIELTGNETHIGSEPDRNYYIYSNISNVEDSFALELKDNAKWKEIKRFEKSFVFISIYERI